MIVRFHGLKITPLISFVSDAMWISCSRLTRNVDFTLLLPFNSSSKLVNAAHQTFPSALFTVPIRI